MYSTNINDLDSVKMDFIRTEGKDGAKFKPAQSETWSDCGAG